MININAIYTETNTESAEQLYGYPNVIRKIRDFLISAKLKYPDTKVDCNGEITYANLKNGTRFDWQVNSRLCPFGWGIYGKDAWAFKCHVYKNGRATVYCYPNGEGRPTEIIEDKIMSEEEVNILYDIMYNSCDERNIWNATLNNIKWKM